MATGERSGATGRWPIAVALGITLVFASILLAVHVPETDIDLEVSASEVSFTLPSQQAITAAMKLDALGAAGARQIRLPLGLDGELPVRDLAAAPASAVWLSRQSGGSSGTITLSAIVVPAGSRVSIRIGTGDQHNVSVSPPSGAELRVAASLLGSVQVGLANADPASLSPQTPKPVTIVGGPGTLDLELVFPPGAARVLASNLVVEDLVLARLEESNDATHTAVRRVPTIRSGTLYLNSLNGQTVTLDPRQALQFRRSEGELRTTTISDTGIELNFSGRVRGMTGGSTRHPIDLMPSLLQWLVANQTLALLWSTALSLFGTWFTIVRWWRNRIGDDYN